MKRVLHKSMVELKVAREIALAARNGTLYHKLDQCLSEIGAIEIHLNEMTGEAPNGQ